MISKNSAKETCIALDAVKSGGSLKGTVKILVSDSNGNDVGILDMYAGHEFGGGIEGDHFLNQSLDTAKVIFSNLAAGKTDYKIAKIAFGNKGHNTTTPAQAVDATSSDVELLALTGIRDTWNAVSDADKFVYDDAGTPRRLSYIEKTIEPSHITYGVGGDQFIVRVPIGYDEFNARTGSGAITDAFEDNLVSYGYIDNAGDIVQAGNANTDGSPVASFTEVKVVDNGDATFNYSFINGIDAAGVVDTVNGGSRPREVSEILLSTDVFTEDMMNKKYSASRMTSGLLSFPEGFTFTFEWTLTWNFA